MKLSDYFRGGVVDPLGYSPTSASIKPVHIANGLSRAVLGQYYDPLLLNRALNRWAGKGTQERHPTDDLVEEAGEVLGDLALPSNRHALDELRQLLKGVLDADSGVYDKNDNCSYTLTHRSHVTRDHNDRRTGDFLFRVLSVDLGQGPSPAIALLRALLSDASDEISVVSLPLTQGEEPLEHTVDLERAPASIATRTSRGQLLFRSSALRAIREGFDTLAAFERARGSKLHSLRRLVSFSTFSIFLHLVNRSLDYEDGRQHHRRRPPILLDCVQRGWTSVAVASHATYLLACKSIDRMVWHGMRAALAEEHGDRWTTRAVEDFIADVELRGPARAQERRRQHFSDVFQSYRAGGAKVGEAFNLAVVDALFEDMSGTPEDFARALGVRGGLLAPRGHRAVKKRYAPSPEMLEVLLAASVPLDEELHLEDLAERWWELFGIVVGGRRDDAATLARWSILDATKADLAANAQALRDSLIEIGYARRYADGVTIIRSAWRG